MERYDKEAGVKVFAELGGVDDFLALTAKTAIEAAIEGHRTTRVYKVEAEESAPDGWAGQPNSTA